MNIQELNSVIKQFEYYRLLGDKTILILSEEQLNWKYNNSSNSIAILMSHLIGNMRSRWTDFLTTDGEKPWRNRDAEFESVHHNRHKLIEDWNQAWDLLLSTLHSLTEEELKAKVKIREQEQSVFDAIIRQLSHYPYHVGQIVFLGKMLLADAWVSLSIPKGESSQYNAKKIASPNSDTHFTDDYLK